MLRETYVLKSIDSGQYSPGGKDKVCMIIEGLNASGTQNIDLSGMVKAGAKVFFQQFKTGTVSSSNVLASSAAVPGDVNVKTMIWVDKADII